MDRFTEGVPRRRFLAAAAASTAVAAAGCLGGAEGEDGVYAFDADPAVVPVEARETAGYEGSEPESFEIETEFGEFGIDAAVSVTTWTATYANPDRGGSLVVASTPDATILGQSVNPLARADEGEVVRRLFDRVQDEAEGVDVDDDEFEDRGSETRRILDTEVAVTTFATTMDVDPDTLPDGMDADDLPDGVDPDDLPDDADPDDVDPDDLPDDVDPEDLPDDVDVGDIVSGDADAADVDVGDIIGGDADGSTDPDGADEPDSGADDGNDAAGGLPVLVHVATVAHDDDVVALVGIHPEFVDEREPLVSLMESVERR